MEKMWREAIHHFPRSPTPILPLSVTTLPTRTPSPTHPPPPTRPTHKHGAQGNNMGRQQHRLLPQPLRPPCRSTAMCGQCPRATAPDGQETRGSKGE